jgi:hypothetical protein
MRTPALFPSQRRLHHHLGHHMQIPRL